ncbi:hypothetical protein HYV81_00460 [Candidatus Woesearchaeota archaeon]|nr:hypothetical protein [Candidatus Woesearchaeota archaeon]
MKSDWSGKLTVRATIEVAGTPKEHIENAMKILIDSVKQLEDIKLTASEVFDAKKLTEEGSLYTIFAELEITARDFVALCKFCFDYTPSAIEVLEPASVELDAASANNFLNDLLSRLHETDMVLKNLRAEHRVLDTNATGLLRNFIMHLLRQKERTLQELSDAIGIPAEQLKPFVQALLESNIVSEVQNTYHLVK